MSDNPSDLGNKNSKAKSDFFIEKRFSAVNDKAHTQKPISTTDIQQSPYYKDILAYMKASGSGSANTQSNNPSPATSSSPSPQSPNFDILFEKASLPYFKDMISFDEILEKWVQKLTIFLGKKEAHCMFNYWHGKSLTGKTTLAKRLAGLDGFKDFTTGDVKTLYFDCYSIKDNFEKIKTEWSDPKKTPYNSIIFIDEFEKCVDEKYKLVDEVFARKFRKFLEDLSRSQKIFFIFLTSESNTRENVTRLLDSKLTSLTDFSTTFPDWTPENLLNVILKEISINGFTIDNNAAAELALHSSQNGKVLELQGILRLLEVELRASGEKHIDLTMMNKILSTRR